MRNFFKLFVALRSIAIIAMVVVIGFGVVACDDDSNDDFDVATIPEQYRGTWLGAVGSDAYNRTLIIATNTLSHYGSVWSAIKVEDSGSNSHIISYRMDKDGPVSANKFSINGSDQLVLELVSGSGSVFYAGTYNRDSSAGNTAVTFSGITANGSATQTTTQLILTFSQSITGLTANDITLSGVSGVTKGTLSGSESTYTLPIDGFTQGGTLNVSVSKTGYTISGSPKTVTIYYYGSGWEGDSRLILEDGYAWVFRTDEGYIFEPDGICHYISFVREYGLWDIFETGTWSTSGNNRITINGETASYTVTSTTLTITGFYTCTKTEIQIRP